ncbi:MAG: sigma 54-interacting transcriptional regulator, partial [Planctomycetota bacterium]
MKSNSPDPPERRRYPRAALQLPVEFYEIGGGQQVARGSTINVSPAGLLVHLPDAEADLLDGPVRVHIGPPVGHEMERNGLFTGRSLRVVSREPLRCALEVLGAPPDFLFVPELVGKHPSMVEIKRSLLEVAEYDVNVLIQGESGTGKNVIADLIHAYSQRSCFPVVRVNCPSIPHELLESELFGHEKGAFTDASSAQPGLLRMANRGTIVLDEISAMPIAMQAKLLQAAEEKRFIPVGSAETIEVDLRVCALTNDNLKKRVAEGAFREDLFYRLNEICMTVPPLRKRKSDIPLLADYFLRKYSAKFSKVYEPLSESATRSFIDYPWFGNVRELENTIKSGLIMGRFSLPEADEPRTETVPAGLAEERSDEPPIGTNLERVRAQAVEDAERRAVLQALRASDYNRTR